MSINNGEFGDQTFRYKMLESWKYIINVSNIKIEVIEISINIAHKFS